MEEKTVKKLNQINRDFYATVAGDFDQSRSYYWVGWEVFYEKLRKLSDLSEPIKVLDVGCGNGRFGSFLKEKDIEIQYEGWDFSLELLKGAKSRLSNVGAKLTEVDIVEEDIRQYFNGKYDLIVLFGLMHHIPSREKRMEIVGDLKEALSENGLLLITGWDFLENERLVKRIVEWSEIDIPVEELEEGDYLLDWRRGERAYRYCHLFTLEQMEEIVRRYNLALIDTFDADGSNEKMNHYFILKNM